VHSFLAADQPSLGALERFAMAGALLGRWRVADAVDPQALLAAADALRAWVERSWAGAVWRREWPLAQRLASGAIVRGSADLVLETKQGCVLVDHKTSGDVEHWGQLRAYEDALRAAGHTVASSWIHAPALGRITRIAPRP
jgi:ATP-dependent helicase/nuclease subunit A